MCVDQSRDLFEKGDVGVIHTFKRSLPLTVATTVGQCLTINVRSEAQPIVAEQQLAIL